MKLHLPAFALSVGLLWGGAVLLVALAHLLWPNYGREFLALIGSLYPGYRSTSGVGAAVIGGLYGLVDGAIGGAVFAWLYNLIATRILRN